MNCRNGVATVSLFAIVKLIGFPPGQPPGRSSCFDHARNSLVRLPLSLCFSPSPPHLSSFHPPFLSNPLYRTNCHEQREAGEIERTVFPDEARRGEAFPSVIPMQLAVELSVTFRLQPTTCGYNRIRPNIRGCNSTVSRNSIATSRRRVKPISTTLIHVRT